MQVRLGTWMHPRRTTVEGRCRLPFLHSQPDFRATHISLGRGVNWKA